MVDPLIVNKLKEKYKDEKVFVIPTNIISDIPDLFHYNYKKEPEIFTQYDIKGRFLLRYQVEGNGTFQQLIPYVVIYNPKTDKYFVSKRTNQSGEQRLYEKYSLGFGGHINPKDGPAMLVKNGLYRELDEEINAHYIGEAIYIGTLRNITSELNDHLGLAFIQYVDDADVKETDKLIGLWLTKEELIKEYSKFEDWAKFLIDYLNSNKKFF